MSTESSEVEKQSRLSHLDGLRALAALMVVLNHCYVSNFRLPPDSTALRLATVWMRTGHFAVAVFIVLSGYSLMISVSRHGGTMPGGVQQFIKRRFRRIVPPYLAALAFSVLLLLTIASKMTGTYWDTNLPLSWMGVFIHGILLQDFVTVRAPNYVFWSIAVEWHIYFLFPVALMLCRRMGFFKGLVAAAIVGEVLLAALDLWLPVMPFLKPFFLLFLMGVAACDLTVGNRAIPARNAIPWRTLGWLFALVAAAGTVLNSTAVSNSSASMFDIALGAAVACLLIVVFDRPNGWTSTLLTWRPLVFVGTFSYSLYLTHTGVVQVVWQYVIHPMRLPQPAALIATVVAVIPCALTFAYGFFLVAERPFLRKAVRRAESKEIKTAGRLSTQASLN